MHQAQLDEEVSSDCSQISILAKSTELDERECEVPYGNDDAADIKAKSPRPDVPIFTGHALRLAAEDGQDDHAILPVQIPFFSNGVCTQAYQRALKNRIRHGDIRPHGCWDTAPFKPVFIHDILMQPGSLANTTGDLSERLIERMTPALLPGYFPHVDPGSRQPCIHPSSSPNDCVQGMLLFGEGRNGRRAIRDHYEKQGARPERRPIHIDVLVPVAPFEERLFPGQRWKLRRRTVMARVWLSTGRRLLDAGPGVPATRWTLERYLAGDLTPSLPLDIRKPDEWDDYEVDVFEPYTEDGNAEGRGVVDGRSGDLGYERCKGWGGW